MTTDSAGITLIKEFEGTILHGYNDQSGYLTIGTGHLVRKGEPYIKGTAISQSVSDIILHSDLRATEYSINTGVTISITQNQFNALVSLEFNIGGHAFGTSHLLRAINAGADNLIIKPLWLEWNRSGGRILSDLVQRRQKEYNLYIS